jgi:hypothetical protein
LLKVISFSIFIKPIEKITTAPNNHIFVNNAVFISVN